MLASSPQIRRFPTRLPALILGFMLAVTAALVPTAGVFPALLAPDSPGPSRARALGTLPMAFVPNAGQTNSAVRFEARTPRGNVFFTPHEVVLARPKAALALAHRQAPLTGRGAIEPSNAAPPAITRVHFNRANPNSTVTGVDRLPGIANYLIGKHPNTWHTDLPIYGGVLYKGLYSGIDVRFGEGTDALGLMATFTVAPGADPSRIEWRYSGATASVDDSTGALEVAFGRSASPTAPEARAIAWQQIHGGRVSVAARFSVAPDGTVGFELGRHDPRQPLMIATSRLKRAAGKDAGLGYSTYLGGSQWDEGYDLDVDAAGHAYVTGLTVSSDFPAAGALRPTFGGLVDAFVAKLSADGRTLLYSTYLGGSNVDVGYGIDVDDAGNAYLAGRTGSDNFPTANALQPTLRGRGCQAVACHDAFIAKLNASGNALAYSTYFGGTHNDEGLGIAVDDAGNAHITGNTDSTDLPTRNALQSAFGSSCEGDLPCPSDTFITKLNPSGKALVYGTYLGGSDSDTSGGIAVDEAGNVYVTGSTRSRDFPTDRARQPTLRGTECGPPPVPCRDVFVTKLRVSGTALHYSTYLGGKETEASGGVAVDGDGNAYVTGSTQSADFPTANALHPRLDNSSCTEQLPKELCDDVFVTQLSADGQALRYSTYLNGGAEDQGLAIVVDENANAYVTGSTDSRNFPTSNAVQPKIGGYIDAFATKIVAGGRALAYSTYLGGTDAERSNAIAVDGSGNAYVAGRTESLDFPTVRALQSGFSGDFDAFAGKLTRQAP
jgi:hypothetical protein